MPTQKEIQTKFDGLADNLSERLPVLSSRRVWRDHLDDWERAYRKVGKGSTFVRARIIGNDIFELAAPVPDSNSSPERNELLEEVIGEVNRAADEVGAKVI